MKAKKYHQDPHPFHDEESTKAKQDKNSTITEKKKTKSTKYQKFAIHEKRLRKESNINNMGGEKKKRQGYTNLQF